MRRESARGKGLKRLLVLLLSIAVMLSFSFVSMSFAATSDSAKTNNGGVTANKKIDKDKTEVNEKTGKPTYTIKLSLSGNSYTSTTEDAGEANVVLILDKSGSMGDEITKVCGSTSIVKEGSWFYGYYYQCQKCGAKYYYSKPDKCTAKLPTGKSRMDIAKSAADSFIDQILPKGSKNHLAIVAFDGKNGGYSDEEKKNEISSTKLTTSSEKESLHTFVKDLPAVGGTNYTAALSKAQDILKGSKLPSYIVFISDGEPGQAGKEYNNLRWNGRDQADELKNNYHTTIYSIGIGDAINGDAAKALKNLASDESHYKEISDSNLASDLPNVLSGLAQTITSNIPAAKTLTLTDVVNTDEFELDNDSLTPGLSNNNGILTWKFDNFPEVGNASDEKSVSFKVTPKNDAYGVCYTNKNVSVTYNDGLSNEAKTIGKDVIGDPKVTLYKAVYLKDDTDNAEELTHFGGLASIEQNVPQPETKPEKDGYTFVKWDNGTISQDGYVKTYKPVWEKNAPTQYTVNYHIGDKVVKTEAVNKGDKTTAPEDLTKEGYHC